MKKIAFILFLITCLIYFKSNKKGEIVAISNTEIIESPSSIGIPEDPNARFNYEMAMIVDPKTGKPNPKQREKELQYVSRMRKKNFQSRGASEDWEAFGPINVGGRTRAFEIDITNSRTFIAGGVSGGVWKTEDLGVSWKRTSDPQQTIDISDLIQDTRPGKENIWYFGTGELAGRTASGGGAPFRGDGIYKSIDNGESWSPLLSTKLGIESIFNSQFQYIWRLAVNTTRTDIDEVLAATYGGILRSTDGGETWSVVLGENLINPTFNLNESVSPFYTDISITSDGRYYAVLSTTSSTDNYLEGGVYYSENGVDWQNITPIGFPQAHDRTVMGVAPGNEDVVYFLTAVREEERFWKLNFSRGGTPSWTDITSNVPDFDVDQGDFNTQFSFNMMLAVDPENENLVYVGGTNLFRSTDGFSSSDNTTWIGGYTPKGGAARYDNHHPDQHVIRFFPGNSNILINANDGGIFITQNSQAEEVTWAPLNNGYITSQFFTIAMQKDESNNLLIGGMQDNGTYIRPDFTNGAWNRLVGGDGSFSYITNEGRYWYFSFQNGRMFRGTLKEDLSLNTFARVDPVNGGSGEVGYLFINPFVIDPAQESIMYLAGGDRIWRNDNLEQIPSGSNDPTGLNWSELEFSKTVISSNGNITRFDGQITALDIAKTVDERLYYGTSLGKLFVIENPQVNSSEVKEITSSRFPLEGYIANITVNQEEPEELIVVFSNHNVKSVFQSLDNGNTFVDISGNLEENPDGSGNGPSVRWVEIAPLSDGTNKYFAGTSAGLFSTDNLDGTSTNWVQEGAQTIGNAVIRMIDYRPLDGRIVVATHGNGVFQSSIENHKLPSNQQDEFGFTVESVYPNPFGSSSDKSRIVYTIPESGTVRVDMFSATGQFITTLLWAQQSKGRNQVFWDGTNNSGQPVQNGIYYFRIRYSTERLGGRLVINR